MLAKAVREGKSFFVQDIVDKALSSFGRQHAAAIINHQNSDGKIALTQAIDAGHLGVATALLG